MLENIYYYVALERFPEPFGFPEELRHTQWWYVADTPDFTWTGDFSKAKKFASTDEAENYMRTGAVSSQFCGSLDRYACHVIVLRESTAIARSLSTVEDL